MELFPAIFIDRDGTVNIDGGYINHPDNFIVYPFAAQAIRMLNVNGYLAVIITNQSGIGRGFYTVEMMNRIHAKMHSHFETQGAHIDGLYYCPHDLSSKIDEYRVDCDCRKPKAGMLEQAIKDLHIDTSRMAMIGDKYSDMQAGFAVGCETIMVETGYGKGDFAVKSAGWPRQPDHRAANLLHAVDILLRGKL